MLQTNGRLVTLLFQAMGDKRNRVQIHSTGTFLGVDILERWLSYPRADVHGKGLLLQPIAKEGQL